MHTMQRVAAHFGIAPACTTLETHQCYITESYLLIFYIIKANERMVVKYNINLFVQPDVMRAQHQMLKVHDKTIV